MNEKSDVLQIPLNSFISPDYNDYYLLTLEILHHHYFFWPFFNYSVKARLAAQFSVLHLAFPFLGNTLHFPWPLFFLSCYIFSNHQHFWVVVCKLSVKPDNGTEGVFHFLPVIAISFLSPPPSNWHIFVPQNPQGFFRKEVVWIKN